MAGNHGHGGQRIGSRVAWAHTRFRVLVQNACHCHNGVVEVRLFYAGAFYIEIRAQMRCMSSANAGRLSFLITSIATAVALEFFQAMIDRKEIPNSLVQWHQNRAQHCGRINSMPLFMQAFQDDLLQVAVGDKAEAIIDEVEHMTIRGNLGIQLSPKEEANKSFDTSFEFIGAHFDTSDTT